MVISIKYLFNDNDDDDDDDNDDHLMYLLPLDETVASTAVFVVVSRANGRKRFWGQLNNSKAVRDRPYDIYEPYFLFSNVNLKPPIKWSMMLH